MPSKFPFYRFLASWILIGLITTCRLHGSLPDSVQANLDTISGGEEKVRWLLEKALNLLDSAPGSMRPYLEEAKGLAEKYGDYDGKCRVNSTYTAYYLVSGRIDSAKVTYRQTMDCVQSMENFSDWQHAMTTVVNFNMRTGEYKEAKRLSEEAIERIKRTETQPGLAIFLHNLALTEKFLGNKSGAIDLLKEAEKLFRKEGNYKGIISCKNNYGMSYNEQGLHKDALKAYQETLALAKEHRFVRAMVTCYINIAEAYGKLGEEILAEEYFLTCIDSAKHYNLERVMAKAHVNLGKLYNRKGDFVKAKIEITQGLRIHQKNQIDPEIAVARLALSEVHLHTQEYQQAIENARQCHAWAQEKGEMDIESGAMLVISNAYDSLGNYKKALEYYRSYQTLRDSLVSSESIRKASDMAAEKEYEKEKELLLVEQKRKDELKAVELEQELLWKNILLVGILGLLLIVVIILVLLSRIRRINKQLFEQRQEILFMNKNLERLVDERTVELEKSNAQLAEYVWTNSHRVRGPIARILGLMQIQANKGFNSPEELEKLFTYINHSAEEADAVIREISNRLE